jgi:hypothetical protein
MYVDEASLLVITVSNLEDPEAADPDQPSSRSASADSARAM